MLKKNFPFLILGILELYAGKVCIMFVYKHRETIEYVKNYPILKKKTDFMGQ